MAEVKMVQVELRNGGVVKVRSEDLDRYLAANPGAKRAGKARLTERPEANVRTAPQEETETKAVSPNEEGVEDKSVRPSATDTKAKK